MRFVTFTSLRENLSAHLAKVEEDHEEMIVIRRNRNPVVVVPLSDWESMADRIRSRCSSRCGGSD